MTGCCALPCAGLAIWVVENPDHIEGDVFGREDHWKGLGIFFDTFQVAIHPLPCVVRVKATIIILHTPLILSFSTT